MKRAIVGVVVFAACAFGQVVAQKSDSAEESSRRIAALSKQFVELVKPTKAEEALRRACNSVSCDSAGLEIQEQSAADNRRRVENMEKVAAAIHAEVDQYIYDSVDPIAFDVSAVREDIQRVLGSAAYGPVYAFTLTLDKERQLVVVYMLPKGPSMGQGATSVTLRAYAPKGSKVVLASNTGSDMDGYINVQADQLRSPMDSELWLLVRGKMTGANGPNIRMRIYAYNGMQFRTVWMPENEWGAFNVQVTERGFVVRGSYYRTEKPRNDSYLLAPDGVYRQTQ